MHLEGIWDSVSKWPVLGETQELTLLLPENLQRDHGPPTSWFQTFSSRIEITTARYWSHQLVVLCPGCLSRHGETPSLPLPALLTASHPEHPVVCSRPLWALPHHHTGFSCSSGSTFPSFYESSQRRQWHPTLVLLPRKSHGQRSLVGYSPWDR